MLHRKLRVVLTVSYYYMLIYGLMPTTLRIKSFQMRICKMSKGYLIYSLCFSGFLLLQFSYTFPSGIFNGYMKNNIVLKWNHIVNVTHRVFAFISCYGIVWLQRRRLIRLYMNFLLHWRNHWPIFRRLVGTEPLQQMQMQLAKILLRQLLVNFVMLLCSVLIQYQLLTEGSLKQILVRACHMLMVSAMRFGFCTLLILLTHQFKAVLLSLRALHRRMGSQSPKDIRRIAAIHSKWLKLARKAFSIYDLAFASVFINMFIVSVSILYHAVQYTNQTIKSDITGYILGDCLIVFSMWNTILVMNLIDQTINSCNDAGHFLRQFNDLRKISPESQKELELFINRVRNNRLVYRIYGCIVLDRPACLGYMASVLNNVIILMQFDMKRKQDMRVR